MSQAINYIDMQIQNHHAAIRALESMKSSYSFFNGIDDKHGEVLVKKFAAHYAGIMQDLSVKPDPRANNVRALGDDEMNALNIVQIAEAYNQQLSTSLS